MEDEVPKPFQKVLIANRGEIALRIIRTCRQLGIKTVAVYSTADALATFVAQADEAICLGGVSTADSYLNVPKILEAIRATGADAVHPGYGFLSENSDFVRTIEAETGAKFLGPPPYAMTHLGMCAGQLNMYCRLAL
jgi:acetyl/propionyl-CoA carboxylase alpha subunit